MQNGETKERKGGFKVEGARPPFYKGLTVLEAERHGDLALSPRRSFEFLRNAQTLLLTAEEIPAAQRDFPVIFSEGESPAPLAVLAARNPDAYLNPDNTWRAGVYQPAYLRRMPFTLARIQGDAMHRALCADLDSDFLTTDPDAPAERRLFEDGSPSELGKKSIRMCEAFDVAVARTESLCRRLTDLGVFERRTIQISSPQGAREFKGLVVISEAKLWALDDTTLAGLARTGALTIAAAHLMSISNFRNVQAQSAT